MKMNKMLAVLLTALFLTPFFAARGESAPAFTVDETAVLRGMDRSWLQGYTPTVQADKWTMILPVRSEAAVGTVTAEMVAPVERAPLFKPGKMTAAAKMETNGLWGVRFTLDLYPDQKNADYPCVIRLTGKDRDGKELAAEIPYTIRMRGAKEGIEKAAIEVAEVKADLAVGEDGEVLVTLENPCAATIIEDLELKISDASGHILPKNAETLKIGTLPIGEGVTVSYPVTVMEKATVAPHVLKLDLNWTALGAAASCSSNNTVSVSQEIRLEQGGVKMPQSVYAGDAVTLTLPLMNMGKADVVNVLATVSMPGITDRQSVLVGTIQPGETKQAQMILSPAKDIAGEFSGTIAVECTDQDGNPASLWVPVSLEVEKPVKADSEKALSGGTAQAEKTPAAVWVLACGCALLLTGLAAQGIVLRRKMHLLEEEKL